MCMDNSQLTMASEEVSCTHIDITAFAFINKCVWVFARHLLVHDIIHIIDKGVAQSLRLILLKPYVHI